MVTCLRAYADSAGPNQPAHQNRWILQNVRIERRGPGDTLYLRIN